MHMKRLENRIALLTGGNTGIGRGVALGFAAEGADVAIAFHGHEAEAVSVAPGLTDTGFDPLSEEAKRAYAARLPLRRLATPDDLVGAFVLLTSEEGRYLCGPDPASERRRAHGLRRDDEGRRPWL
jgi:NAD(P)-dependent dehydrogenase (short-subunit alcohol dehydrogenase family)